MTDVWFNFAVLAGRDGHTRVTKVACGVKTVVIPINKLIPRGINC